MFRAKLGREVGGRRTPKLLVWYIVWIFQSKHESTETERGQVWFYDDILLVSVKTIHLILTSHGFTPRRVYA